MLAAVVLVATMTAPAAHSIARAAVRPTQELAVLHAAHEAYAQPTARSRRVATVQGRRPLTGVLTVLPVLGHHGVGAGGGPAWLRVSLPGRPNGRSGWISARQTTSSTTRRHIVIDLSARLMTVYQSGRPIRTARVVVGKPSTPTPLGRSFVEEVVELRSGEPGAPYALALSARSNVLQEFAGGPGQIALHGLANIGGRLGSAASHGCVRLTTATMRWLVHQIRPGVPVTVRT